MRCRIERSASSGFVSRLRIPGMMTGIAAKV